MSPTSRYYQSTGSAPPAGIIMMIVGGALAGMTGGAIYGPLDHYNPIIYINILATVGVGFVSGMAVMMAGRAGKVRSRPIYGVVGLIAGAVAVYSSWVSYIWVIFGREDVYLDPMILQIFIEKLATVGAWNIRGTTPTGGVLYAIWSLEIMVIAYIAYATAMTDMEPFCESCDIWTDESQGALLCGVEDPMKLKAELESEKYNALNELPPPGANEGHALVRLDLHKCPRCFNSNYLTAKELKITLDKEGKEEVKETPVFTHLRVPQSVHDKLKASGEKAAAQAHEPAAG